MSAGAVLARALVLAALLAPLAGSYFAKYHDNRDCKDPQRPTITAANYEDIYISDSNMMYLQTYGEDNSVLCSADYAANLTIESEGKCLPTAVVNTTTIQSYLKKPKVGEYKYTCRNNRTNSSCDHTMILRVEPNIYVTSPSIRHTRLDGSHVYYVPPGEAYEVVCTGNILGHGYMTPNGEHIDENLVEESVITTITFKVHAATIGIVVYYCSHEESMGSVELIVDVPPAGLNFQCVEYTSSRVKCEWDSSSTRTMFKLFLIDHYHDDSVTLLCVDASEADENRMSCSWFESTAFSFGSLVLQSCNKVFCDNQTFPFDGIKILKQDPPTGLKLENISSHSVVLEWENTEQNEFRVEYQLLTTSWRQANTSSVHCADGICKYLLALPCPDAHYEVRVYQKATFVIGDIYWSEPASRYFFTGRQHTGDVISPECNAKFEAPKPRPSVEVALNQLRQLISDDREEESALRDHVSAMKGKVAKIKELMDKRK